MGNQKEKYKKIISSNILKLMYEQGITRDGDVYEQVEGIPQSKFSTIKSGKDLPTLEQLIELADFFDVSIDSLINRTIIGKEEQTSLKSICKFLVTALNASCHFKTQEISVKQHNESDDPELPFSDGFTERKYEAFFFSEELAFLQESQKAHIVNNFIRQYQQIKKMKTNKDLTQDMYERLLESYLNEVEASEKKLVTEYEIFNEPPLQ